MECRVEDGDVGHVGKRPASRAYALQVRRVMQRCESRKLVNLRLNLGGDQGRPVEDRSAVHHAMTDRDNVRGRPQPVEHPPHSGLMVRDAGAGLADPFDKATQRDLLGLDIDELVFDRRGAGVDDENLGHGVCVRSAGLTKVPIIWA